MSESRRVTSTARSIQRSWLWRLFKLYFWLDLLLAILAIGCFCFYEELSALGAAWTPGIERTVEMGAQGGFFQRVWDAVYIFYSSGGRDVRRGREALLPRRHARRLCVAGL